MMRFFRFRPRAEEPRIQRHRWKLWCRRVQRWVDAVLIGADRAMNGMNVWLHGE